MARFLAAAIATACFLSSTVLAQGTTCGNGQNCPENLPCCSQYGQCGVGAYCLGGCDPLFSHSLDSCMPAPVCNSQDYNLNSLNGIEANTKYLGDSSKAQWVSSGSPVPYPKDNPDSILLTMPKNSVGTLLASTNYVWYGKVTAQMKTSRTQGVVTAFILLSDVKDEIDFEFVGTDLNSAQSNYYFQGIPNYTHELNLTVQDTFDDYHNYTIDWSPDSLTWSIDGTALRTLNRNQTWNTTANRYDYPQTPARVQLSLWPAGLPSNGQGTVEWAGGLINWDAPDVTNAGYYYARVAGVSVECYDPPSGSSSSGTKSYVYNNDSGLNNTVEITNDDTVLNNFEDSGLNPTAGAPQSAQTAASTVPNVPGVTGGGGAVAPSGTAGAVAATGGPGGPVTANGPAPSTYHGFSQGNGNGNTGSAANVKGEKMLQGSMLAVLLAIAGLLVM